MARSFGARMMLLQVLAPLEFEFALVALQDNQLLDRFTPGSGPLSGRIEY
jgi:hypothetical protein